MGLCSWAGAHHLLPVLVLVSALHVKAEHNQAKERHYYIAAEEIDWSYSGNGTNRFNPIYKKVVFREYDKDFRKPKPHPSWLGLLGPTLRAEEGETIVVTFRNRANGPYSLHSHGVNYGKQSEGANYFDNTSLKEKEDDLVYPNQEHVYYWEVTSKVSPQPDDPNCLTYTYFSHKNVVEDYNSGLIGTLLICKPGSLDESGKQVGVHKEYTLLFGVFDEKQSIYDPRGFSTDNHVMYTINGYAEGALPDVHFCAHTPVSLHLVGMSSNPEVFSVHINGQVLIQDGHKVSSVGLISGSSATVSLVAPYAGRWLLSSQNMRHIEAGLHGFVDIKKCEEFKEPTRTMTIAQKRQSTEWKYYIAAEEVVWDYSPNMQEHVDEDFKRQYLTQSSTRIGAKYKKAVYTLYKNESFTERLENAQIKNELGILGPVIRAQIRDVIKIIFKNMASRPFSIYPNGLMIEKSQEGVNYPKGGNHSHMVKPGETHTYVWKVLEENEPLDADSRCLTRMYHSAVDTPRDIASGLIGPILICKSQSLNVRNVQVRADKEQQAVFAMFDENKSWYLDDNIRLYSDVSKVNKADRDFYDSNVMHTINGYAFESGPVLGFCNGEVATWHVSSIGAQNHIQTATFYGHPFELNGRTEDFLSLYPMTGETITMNMDNIGVWLLASLNSHGTTKGLRTKFQDVECYRELQYDDDFENPALTVWNPPTLDEIKKEKEEPKTKTKATTKETDPLTDIYAEWLNIRSQKTQSRASDVEELDLSFLDYDAIDVDGDITLKEPNHQSSSKPYVLNKTQSSNGKKMEEVVFQNQSISDIAAYSLRNTTAAFDSLSIPQTKNKTVFSEYKELTKNSSLTLNASLSKVVSSPESASFSTNTTFYKSTASTRFQNVSSETINVTAPLQATANLTMPLQDTTNVILDLQGNANLTLTVVTSTRTSQNTTNVTEDSEDNHKSTTEIQKAASLNTTLPGITHPTEAFLDQTNTTFESQDITNVTTGSPIQQTVITEISDKSNDLTMEIRDGIPVALPQNQTSFSENETTNTQFLEDSSPAVDKGVVIEPEGQITRGDVFLYDVFGTSSTTIQHNSTVQNATVLSNTTTEQVYDNKTKPVDVTVGIKLWFKELNSNSSASYNWTLESITNATHIINDNFTVTDHQLQENSSKILTVLTNTCIKNVTDGLPKGPPSLNITVNASRSVPSNTNEYNVTSNVENLTNTYLESLPSEVSVLLNHSEKLSSNISSSLYDTEEVFIYLNKNTTEGIKTFSCDPQDQNWTYDVIHNKVPQEIPDDLKKYFEKETLTTTPPPKKTKKVVLKQLPKKGQGMKTRRKKVYKPQERSDLPLSPRGFSPEMTPRGNRPLTPQPVSNDEELVNQPIVIGVPLHGFSDYQLYIPGKEPDHLEINKQDVTANEYEYVMFKDPYSDHKDIMNMNLDETTKYYLELSGPNTKTYFIAAEEVEWDYAGNGQRRPEKSQVYGPETKFTKVIFRGYLDSDFSTPDIRGELDEHLGILGPVIKAEVGQTIMVVFRNRANRPYSIHPNGVSYTKQTEGLSYEDGSKNWYKYDNEVLPNTTFTYIWKASTDAGPGPGDSNCRTWAYYSGVNPEKDIHSGLIGPLLVCREGTLDKQEDSREFTLLFMTFDESQSWYYNQNFELLQRKSRRRFLDASLKENLKFHSINGIIFNLKGLRMYTDQLVYWHLLNMGSSKDFQSVHFHGQTFITKKTKSHRQAVYPLLPGSFATLEMYPSKPGLWQLETEIGLIQQKGMQTLFLVLDNDCYHPLGLESGSVKDNQITAIHTRGYWKPHLARLNNNGRYNAWSTENNSSWIQVDFQRPVVISQVAIQGAKQLFQSQYVTKYYISYSNDNHKWSYYKGDSKYFWKEFPGNQEAYETKTNTFSPPVFGRFIRLHPIEWYKSATVRMEFYGCELDGCSVPLGMESGKIQDHSISASSTASSWFGGSWSPFLARLNKQGAINAWRAKNINMNQWLQVELPKVKKITGIITQGALSLGKEMYVTSYTIQYSDNGVHWTHYSGNEEFPAKKFSGNTNNSDHVRNYIYPPIFSRYIRIVPERWIGSITMRIELLGCDFE
uniref:ferroxidase n=1 Tax=Oryzias latipes TaxID=8090 RepID=A0A3P9KGY4_ORYLA